MRAPIQGDKGTCRFCGRPILYFETSIDNFWSHAGGGPGFCDPRENWRTAKQWAEPKEWKWRIEHKFAMLKIELKYKIEKLFK